MNLWEKFIQEIRNRCQLLWLKYKIKDLIAQRDFVLRAIDFYTWERTDLEAFKKIEKKIIELEKTLKKYVWLEIQLDPKMRKLYEIALEVEND